MRIPLLGATMMVAVTLAGCSSDVAVMRDHTGGFAQERYIYACEDNKLCGVSRLYDVNWQSYYAYPIDFRVKAYEYIPSRTQYFHQGKVIVLDPSTNHHGRNHE